MVKAGCAIGASVFEARQHALKMTVQRQNDARGRGKQETMKTAPEARSIIIAMCMKKFWWVM
ncbi:hypothetical protein G8E10_12945 [Rhizobiaceae bacterium CRRU44]|uniref:Uncharacterized protein n=1 Tax=Ferranicluibacter rubi TaxID=2715133 RepID=A0AA43ZEZ7_9HYPH|nr:hypothetical protein [Ferranicluibacter rubi]NHT76647.1 hypothetical protein [Ferranicluibacter rubi]